MTTNTDPVRAHDELRVQAALLRTPEFMAQFDPDKFARQLERIAAALASAPPSAPVGVEEMQRRLDREESDHGRTIDQRDAAEDALGRMFQAVTGRPAEWSSAWGYVDAIEEVEEHVAALAQQPAARGVVDGCHCATCTCNPGMTPAIRFDTSPAAQEGAIRDHLIALGWTPPGAQQPAPPSAPAQPQFRVSVDEAAAQRLADAAKGDLGWSHLTPQARVEKARRYLAPAAQAPRACTCHPDDRPDGPCRERYAASECQALAAQAQAANADALDAARYRWLRDREIPEWLDLWHQNPDRIDAAIDQAMKE